MARTTWIRFRIAVLVALTGSALLTGCSEQVTMPVEPQAIGESPSSDRDDNDPTYEIKDPNVPVEVRDRADRGQGYEIRDPNVTVVGR